MGKLLVSAALVVFGMSFGVQAGESVNAEIDKVFVPAVFSQNDSVQFVIAFNRPNGCYKPGKTELKIDREHHVIEVTKRLIPEDGFCLEVVENLYEDVSAGAVPSGRYKIVDGPTGIKIGDFEVSPRAPELNRQVPVTGVQADMKTGVIRIQGLQTSGCVHIEGLKRLDDRADVLVVYPEASVDLDKPCLRVVNPFERRLTFKADRPTLIHVKNAGGPAINTMVWKVD